MRARNPPPSLGPRPALGGLPWGTGCPALGWPARAVFHHPRRHRMQTDAITSAYAALAKSGGVINDDIAAALDAACPGCLIGVNLRLLEKAGAVHREKAPAPEEVVAATRSMIA